MNGEFDADLVFGGTGNDEIGAGFDPDDPGDDVLFGGSGDDVVAFAAAGDDRLDGGPGDDTIQGGQGNDRLSGGLGNDTLGSPVDVDVEEGDDRLLGGPGDDGLDGGPGFDRLNGQTGVDSCVNGEVLVSCEASAAAAGSRWPPLPEPASATAAGSHVAAETLHERRHLRVAPPARRRRASKPLAWPARRDRGDAVTAAAPPRGAGLAAGSTV